MFARVGIFVVVGIALGGCVDTSSNTDLVTSGPPEIAQVLMTERVINADGTSNPLPDVFAFGTLPTEDPGMEHAVTTAAAAGQTIFIIMDQLLRGNRLEQIQCRDNVVLDAGGNPSPWGDVPDDATPDDIAKCAVNSDALSLSCTGSNLTCICQIASGCGNVAMGAPVGVLDTNSDGAADTQRLKPGSVDIVCGTDRSIKVPLDLANSFYNPSGDQLVPAKGGLNGMSPVESLGPQIVLTPTNTAVLPVPTAQLPSAKALPTSTTCGLAFDPSVVDKTDLQVCAIPGGRPASCTGRLADCPQFQQGCMPGDVSAISWGTEPMTLSSTVNDNQQNVMLTALIDIDEPNSIPFDPNTIQNITITPAPPNGVSINVSSSNLAEIQVTFGTGLAPSTMYTLTVPTTVTDSFGQPPVAPLVVHFTTAAM